MSDRMCFECGFPITKLQDGEWCSMRCYERTHAAQPIDLLAEWLHLYTTGIPKKHGRTLISNNSNVVKRTRLLVEAHKVEQARRGREHPPGAER